MTRDATKTNRPDAHTYPIDIRDWPRTGNYSNLFLLRHRRIRLKISS